MIHKIEKLFNDQIRPALAAHGGNVEVIDVDNNKLYLRMVGGCQGCSSSTATLRDGIQTLVKQNFPDIVEIIDVTNHSEGENPYFK
ncbi:MAG: NifU family protein [Bacteriovoracaceae bacterium]